MNYSEEEIANSFWQKYRSGARRKQIAYLREAYPYMVYLDSQTLNLGISSMSDKLDLYIKTKYCNTMESYAFYVQRLITKDFSQLKKSSLQDFVWDWDGCVFGNIVTFHRTPTSAMHFKLTCA